MVKKGITVALGTDGSASSNRLDIWEAGKFAALLQKGITHDPTQILGKTVLEMMTVNGMKALGIKGNGSKTVAQIKKDLRKIKDYSFLYE